MRTARVIATSVVVAALLLVISPTADAASNGGALVAMNSGSYRVPLAVIAQPDSGALTFYYDELVPTQLSVQHVDRRGRRLLGPLGAPLPIDLSQNFGFSAIADGVGGCVLAYSKQRGASGRDLIVQRLDANGTRLYGADGLVVCDVVGDQDAPALVLGNSGDYFVLWNDARGQLGAYRDIFFQHLTLAGGLIDPANGTLLNWVTHHSIGDPIRVVRDFSGGFVLLWTSSNNGGARAQRVTANSVGLWGVEGIAVGSGLRPAEALAPDGNGGVWVATRLADAFGGHFYLHHVLPNGLLGYAAAGADVVAYTGDSVALTLIRNASGGCFGYWFQAVSGTGSHLISRQEVNSAGTLLRGSQGEQVTAASQFYGLRDVGGSAVLFYALRTVDGSHVRLRLNRMAPDGTPAFGSAGMLVGREWPPHLVLGMELASSAMGPVTIAWSDDRFASPTDAFRIQLFGQAFATDGTPLWDDSELPTIRSVKDAPADQGGRVNVAWDRGAGDETADACVRGYRVWRSLPAGLLGEDTPDTGDREGTFRLAGRTLLAQAGVYWQLAGEQPAATLPSYDVLAATTQDSVAGAPADQVFMVEAYDDSSRHWFSGSLSGRSVDNLAPALVPAAAGYYLAGSASLFWGGVSDSDLSGYEVFRGATAAFTPSMANRVASTSAVHFEDAFGAPAYYRIAARDIHGNLGPSALIQPSGTTDAETSAPLTWTLRGPKLSRGGSVELTLDVPRADEGRLEIFDVIGRKLWSQRYRTDGAHSLAMRATPASGLQPGVVYAQATSASGWTQVLRIVVVR